MSKFGDLMQVFMMGTPKRANWFLTHMPEKAWHKIGGKKALEVFHETAKRVPAYKDFLRNQKIEAAEIKSIEDLEKVPWTDKKNYLSRYELEELCLDSDLNQTHTISSSSGSTGECFYWPRLASQDKMSENILELTYKNCYGIDKDSTLFIVCFALGTWVAGEMCLGLAQAIAKKDYPMTVISPGMDLQESLKTVKNLGKKYDQIVIAGYPPFVKDVIEGGEKEGISWSEHKVKFLCGGEGFSEQWRDYLMSKVGIRNELSDVINLYASADVAGVMGSETPFTILIRRLASKDRGLARDLFDCEIIPSLIQYSPAGRYFIVESDEITLTAMGAIPLIRYNTHDMGGIISFGGAMEVLRSHGYDPLKILTENQLERYLSQLPLLFIRGRSDSTATIYAVNVYPENVKHALEKSVAKDLISGKFKMQTINHEKTQNQLLQLDIELAQNKKPSTKNSDELLRELLSGLSQINAEFKRLKETVDDKPLLAVRLHGYKSPPFFDTGEFKHKYVLENE